MVTSTTAKFSRDELCERWGIKYTQYYERLKALNLDSKHLTEADIEELDRLDVHVKNGGKIKDFAAEENSTQSESAIAPTTESEAIAPRENPVEPDEANTEGLAIPDPPPEPETPESEIYRHAAELKAYYATHPDLVALHLASQMGEDDLPPDLAAKVYEVREAAHPKPNQRDVAAAILQRHKNQTSGKS
ncbi:MAG: hypothetical protein ACOC07_20855 [Coleofasciculus sp.]